jgi:predicted ATPase
MFGYRDYGDNLSIFLGLAPKTAAVINIDSTNRRKMYCIYIYIYYYCIVVSVEVPALTVNGNKKFISDEITTNISVALFKIHFLVLITDRSGPEYCSRYSDSLRAGQSGDQILV